MALSDTISKRYQDLLSGKLKFYEMPEFRGFAERLSTAGARTREAMGPQLRRMGIRGPAAAMAMEQAGEGAMSPLAGYGTNLLSQIPQWALNKQQLDQSYILGMGQLREMRKMRRLQRHAQKGQAGFFGDWF